MATTKKTVAAKKAATNRKPPAPVIEVKRAAQSVEPKAGEPVVSVTSGEEVVKTYRVTGRIRRGGLVLRPAVTVIGRDADTVELTDREAFGLAGFVEPVNADDGSDDDAKGEQE